MSGGAGSDGSGRGTFGAGEKQAEVGLIGRLAELQRAVNEERAAMTPKERSADARRQLEYIASVEPEMAWIRGA